MAVNRVADVPRGRKMRAAHALSVSFGVKHVNIARALEVSQSTISQWVKEEGFKRQIAGLEDRIEAKDEYIDTLLDEISSYEG